MSSDWRDQLRPPPKLKGATYQVRVPAATDERMTAFRVEHDVTTSAVIRVALDRFFAEVDGADQV